MKDNFFLTLSCLLVFVLFFSNCKNDEQNTKGNSVENTQLISSLNPILRTTPRPYDISRDRNVIENLVIPKNDSSYFNLQQKIISVNIPVSDSIFQIYGAYHIYSNGNDKGIALLISNKSVISDCGNSSKYILDLKIPLKKVKPTTRNEALTLNEKDRLKILIINDFPFDFTRTRDSILKELERTFSSASSNFTCEPLFFKSELVRPRESGGGVIIEGP